VIKQFNKRYRIQRSKSYRKWLVSFRCAKRKSFFCWIVLSFLFKWEKDIIIND